MIVQGSGLARKQSDLNSLLLPKQCTCVDTKALMIKRDKPVEQAQIRGPVFMTRTQSAQLLLFIKRMCL